MIQAKQAARSTKYKIVADDGFFAEDLLQFVSTRNELDVEEVAYFKDRTLSRQERLNGLTKNFHCLTKQFHHDRGSINDEKKHLRHKACVEAVCVAIQYELDLGLTRLVDAYPV